MGALRGTVPDLVVFPAPPLGPALASALGATRMHGHARGLSRARLANLPSAFAGPEGSLQ
eukprot:14195408-Alexandrium_andersonii.AAC.1